MNNDNVFQIVKSCVADYYLSQGIEKTVDASTRLVGAEAIIDSMGLVNIIVDIEGRLMDSGVDVTIASEKAMSMTRSPFKSVQTLSDFIFEEIN